MNSARNAHAKINFVRIRAHVSGYTHAQRESQLKNNYLTIIGHTRTHTIINANVTDICVDYERVHNNVRKLEVLV